MKVFEVLARSLVVIGAIVVLLVGWNVYLNRQRLDRFADAFCSLELPAETYQSRCHRAMGILTSEGGDHCDYLAWMRLYTNLKPAEVDRHFSELSLAGTDGETRVRPAVYVGTFPAPAPWQRVIQVRITDVGHPAGLDPQCRIYGVR